MSKLAPEDAKLLRDILAQLGGTDESMAEGEPSGQGEPTATIHTVDSEGGGKLPKYLFNARNSSLFTLPSIHLPHQQSNHNPGTKHHLPPLPFRNSTHPSSGTPFTLFSTQTSIPSSNHFPKITNTNPSITHSGGSSTNPYGIEISIHPSVLFFLTIPCPQPSNQYTYSFSTSNLRTFITHPCHSCLSFPSSQSPIPSTHQTLPSHTSIHQTSVPSPLPPHSSTSSTAKSKSPSALRDIDLDTFFS